MDDDSRIAETVTKLKARLNDGEKIDKIGRQIQAVDRHYSNLVSGALIFFVTVLLICGAYMNAEQIPIPVGSMLIAFGLLCAGQCIWFWVDAREKNRSKKLPTSERLVVVTNQRVRSLHMSNFDILELGPQSEIFEITDADGITTIAMADGKKIQMKKEADALLLKFKTDSPEV